MKEYQHDKYHKIKVFDLFCGVGGLSKGIKNAGLTVVGGLDVEKKCKLPYEANIGAEFIHKTVTDFGKEKLSMCFNNCNYSVLVGCAPCQTFSTHTAKNKNRQKDSKWSLINEFLRIVEETKPTVLSMENVPGLINQNIFKSFVLSLEKLGYFLKYQVIDCTKYGIPQSRKRLVLLGSLLGKINFPLPSKQMIDISLSSAIGHLPKIKAGESDKKDPLHFSASLSELNLKRAKCSKPGGSWKDWPEELILDCHKKDSGQSYTAVYGRLEWDKPCSTITTQFHSIGTGRFIHPEQDRGLTPREAALIQTFPNNYIFYEGKKKILKVIGKLIGNAVPVKLGELIGKAIKQHIEFHEK